MGHRDNTQFFFLFIPLTGPGPRTLPYQACGTANSSPGVLWCCCQYSLPLAMPLSLHTIFIISLVSQLTDVDSPINYLLLSLKMEGLLVIYKKTYAGLIPSLFQSSKHAGFLVEVEMNGNLITLNDYFGCYVNGPLPARKIGKAINGLPWKTEWSPLRKGPGRAGFWVEKADPKRPGS